MRTAIAILVLVTGTAAADKLDRDLFPEGGHQSRLSANVAVRWRDAPVTDAHVQLVLDVAERAWAKYAGEFAMAEPTGATAARLNIYISTGTDVPSIDFFGGVASRDLDGNAYLVLSSLMLPDPASLRVTTAHELFHCFQTDAFTGSLDSAWYHEASANWAQQQILIDEQIAFNLIGAYALAEELPMYYLGNIFDPDIAGVHQYGASVFLHYLTESQPDHLLIPASYKRGAPTDDALDFVMRQPASDPEAVADRFGEFAAHSMLWDMPRSSLIAKAVAEYAIGFPQRPRFDARIAPEGTADFVAVASGRELHAFSSNQIFLARPIGGLMQIDLRSTAAARFRATLVRVRAGAITYTPVAMTTPTTVEFDPDEDHAFLVVAATADTRSLDATFPYEFRIQHLRDDEPTADTGGCSCGATGTRSYGWLLVVLCVVPVVGRSRARSAAS